MKENKILIGGDYSGIQGYIYTIASKYAGINLKGRSNSLREECENTARRISQKVDGDIVVSSGGTFLMMAEDTPQNIEALKCCQAEEERRIFEEYGTELYLAIDYVRLQDVGSYHEATSKLFLKRDAKKNQRLARLLKEDYEAFFEPKQWYYGQRDAITGAYFRDESEKRECEGVEGFITEQTLRQIEKGEELARNSRRERRLNKLVRPDAEADLTRLGVLRMDVDNLGTGFQNEIKKCSTNLDGYRQLSRCFTEFFSENNLYRLDEEESVYIVYSGGDDIFAVGRWDNAIAFAEKVKDEFSRQTFVKDRGLTISGGVAILSPKYPIMKGAQEGGDLEDLAKSHSVGHNEKNSIAFLGMALNWDKEYPKVKNLKNKIVKLDEQLGSSFRSKLLRHYMNAEIRDHKVSNLKTFWMMAYDLSRFKDRNKGNDEIVQLINNCIKETWENCRTLIGVDIETDYHILELWALACRWAELELRTKKND